MTRSTTARILYVDDDNDDFFFLKESMINRGFNAELIAASNGEEAIEYLEHTTQLPDLIILDLNMPRLDGRQTLHYLKDRPVLRSIPVVILSTSESRNDREICKSLGAISYHQKPSHYDGYTSIIESFVPILEAAV